MDNPLRDPEQLELRPKRLDPEFDDLPQEQPLYHFVLGYGPTYTVYGIEALMEEIERLTGDAIDFTLTYSGESGYDPEDSSL